MPVCPLLTKVSHFYPRPPRGGRPCIIITAAVARYFYPRPPRGGRRVALGPLYSPIDFYPRPPRGGRPRTAGEIKRFTIFLSTPSARRATKQSRFSLSGQYISIHALREEGDDAPGDMIRMQNPFLSTPSARRATSHAHGQQRNVDISIHALREEGDDPL